MDLVDGHGPHRGSMDLVGGMDLLGGVDLLGGCGPHRGG